MNTLNYSGGCDWAWGCDRAGERGGKAGRSGSPHLLFLLPFLHPSPLFPGSVARLTTQRRWRDAHVTCCEGGGLNNSRGVRIVMTDSDELCNSQKHIQMNPLKKEQHLCLARWRRKSVIQPQWRSDTICQRDGGGTDDPSDPPISGRFPDTGDAEPTLECAFEESCKTRQFDSSESTLLTLCANTDAVNATQWFFIISSPCDQADMHPAVKWLVWRKTSTPDWTPQGRKSSV